MNYPDANYFLDNYGHCNLKNKCTCLSNGWKGQLCPEWKPLGIKSLEELNQNFLKTLEKSETHVKD